MTDGGFRRDKRPRGAPLLPASRPGNAALVLQLRAAHLHLLHDAGGGRHAMPGVRRAGRAHEGGDVRLADARRHGGPGGDLRPDRRQRAGVHRGDGPGGGAVGRARRIGPGAERGPPRTRGRRRRLVASGQRRLPPRQRDPPRLQHVPAVDPGWRLRALRRPLAPAGGVLLGAPLGRGRGAAAEPGLPHGGRLGSGLRPDGGPLPAGAPARGGPAGLVRRACCCC